MCLNKSLFQFYRPYPVPHFSTTSIEGNPAHLFDDTTAIDTGEDVYSFCVRFPCDACEFGSLASQFVRCTRPKTFRIIYASIDLPTANAQTQKYDIFKFICAALCWFVNYISTKCNTFVSLFLVGSTQTKPF